MGSSLALVLQRAGGSYHWPLTPCLTTASLPAADRSLRLLPLATEWSQAAGVAAPRQLCNLLENRLVSVYGCVWLSGEVGW